MATSISDYIVPFLVQKMPWQLEYQITLPTDHLSMYKETPWQLRLVLSTSSFDRLQYAKTEGPLLILSHE